MELAGLAGRGSSSPPEGAASATSSRARSPRRGRSVFTCDVDGQLVERCAATAARRQGAAVADVAPRGRRGPAVRRGAGASSAGSTCSSTTPASAGRWPASRTCPRRSGAHAGREPHRRLSLHAPRRAAAQGTGLGLHRHHVVALRLFGGPSRSPYVASKWAIIGFTKTIAMELGPFGVRANAICPGGVEGERLERVIRLESEQRGITCEQLREDWVRGCSLRTFVKPEDVAAMILFLCSEQGARISGQADRRGRPHGVHLTGAAGREAERGDVDPRPHARLSAAARAGGCASIRSTRTRDARTGTCSTCERSRGRRTCLRGTPRPGRAARRPLDLDALRVGRAAAAAGRSPTCWWART